MTRHRLHRREVTLPEWPEEAERIRGQALESLESALGLVSSWRFFSGRRREDEQFEKLAAYVRTEVSLAGVLEQKHDAHARALREVGEAASGALSELFERALSLSSRSAQLRGEGRKSQDEALKVRAEELAILARETASDAARLCVFLLENLARRVDALAAFRRKVLAHRSLVDRLSQALEADRLLGRSDALEYRKVWIAPLSEGLERLKLAHLELESATVALCDALEKTFARRSDELPLLGRLEHVVQALTRRRFDALAFETVLEVFEGARRVAFASAPSDPGVESIVYDTAEVLRLRLEALFGAEYEAALAEGSPRALRLWLQRHPYGARAQEVRDRLEKEEQESAARLSPSTGLEALRAYLEAFPEGSRAGDVRELLKAADLEAQAQARLDGGTEAWLGYLSLHPQGLAAEEARERLDFAAAWARNTPDAWRLYLSRHPAGEGAGSAKESLEALSWVPLWAVDAGLDALPNGSHWADFELSGVRVRMRLVQAGTYLAGSPREEQGRETSEELQEVTFSSDLWVSEVPVTRALWGALEQRTVPAGERELPVDDATWFEAQRMCRRLGTRVLGLAARLPTEAEWEYFCRAGTSGPFAHEELGVIGWYEANSGGKLQPVRRLRPNAWGLFDCHGNVAEWCDDGPRRHERAPKAVDPVGERGATRSLRGGGAASAPERCRSAARGWANPQRRFGFRLVVEAGSRRKTSIVEGERTVFLGDLRPLRHATLEGPLRVNECWSGTSVLVGTELCERFVAMHAPAHAAWRIPPGATRFTAVGTSSEVSHALSGSWCFHVFVDGVHVLSTPALQDSRPGLVIDLPLGPNAIELELRVDPLGDDRFDQTILAWPFFHLRRDPLEELSLVPEGAVFLDELEPVVAPLSWRQMSTSHAPQGVVPGLVRGRRATKWISLPVPSSVQYAVPLGSSRFTAIALRCDDIGALNGDWRLRVRVDEEELLLSSFIHESPDGSPLELALKPGASRLTLEVESAPGAPSDDAVLAWACFRAPEDL